MRAECRCTLDHVDPATDELGRAGELRLQIDAVVHQQNLEIFQIRGRPQHARDEHHRQRFTRALRMPHHTGPSFRRLAPPQTLHDFSRRAVLLVATHDLHPPPAVGIHEDRAGAQYIEQDRRCQQALNQFLLLALYAERWRVGAPRFRPDILPRIEVLMTRGDRAELGFLAAGPNQQ